MVPSIYHERQRGNYCRLHALNNFIGKHTCNFAQFNKYCDEYDTINKVSKKTSRSQIFYNNGGNDNIFGYILGKSGYSYKMHHYDFYRNKTIKICSETSGFILYTKQHAFCIKKHTDNQFYLIDSMKTKPMLVDPISYCKKINLGVIQLRAII